MPIRIDFTDVESRDFSPIPPGVYPAVVHDAVVKEARTSKQPYVNWEFRITEGEFENRHLWYTTSLQPQSLWSLQQLLVRLGVAEDQLASVFDLDLEEMLGRPCQLVVGEEQYDGQPRNRVFDVLQPEEESEYQTQSPPLAPISKPKTSSANIR